MNTLPFGRIVAGRQAGERLRMAADVVIVGLGAGGCMAAHDLARAGLSVIALERGAFLRPSDMTQREDEMIPKLFAEQGARQTSDLGVTILQGKGVGGSTLHNTNLCKRLPDELVQEWREHHGLPLEGLDADFEAVETLLNVHRVPDERMNANNRIIERGIQSLGWRGGRLAHNRDDRCQQSGFCELGCAYNGKTNALRVLVPPAIESGALFLTDARVDQIEFSDRKATGVRGVFFDASGLRQTGEFTIHASTVILAGSATSSAALFRHSRIPDRSGLAGRTLHMHPGAAVMGLHDERIEGWKGNPQAVECTEFLEFGAHAKNRAWIVSGFAHPAGAASLMPGFGAEHARLMRQFAHASVAICMLHDITRGTVDATVGDTLRVHYTPNAADREQLLLGLKATARILLAGGAREVMIPLSRPVFVSSPNDLEHISISDIRPGSPSLTAVHPMSTLPMGGDSARSVCAPNGRVHTMDNLFVADGSLFPTSIGGPPQISIYTFGRRVARSVAAMLGKGSV